MDRLLFGTAGAPNSTRPKTTQAGVKRVAELGLECMEVEFVRGVKMGPETARGVGELADRLGIKLSAHGPYYINLNSRDEPKVASSDQHILKTARITHAFGGRNVIFHAAAMSGGASEEVFQKVKQHLLAIIEQLKAEHVDVLIRPEVMGRESQFGSADELIRLSQEVSGVLPCFDFAHMHARAGKFNTYADFAGLFKKVVSLLGPSALHDIAIHVSGIEFTLKGEKKHLDLKQSDFNYLDFVRALKDCDVRGLVICESPSREQDALLLQEEYQRL